MNRRSAVGLLGLGVLASRLKAAQQHLHAARTKPADYRPRFFNASEIALLDQVGEMILPADQNSGGAREARVSLYIDLVAANSARDAQANWRARLAAFEKLAADRTDAALAALLDTLAAREKQPLSDAEHFFADMKRMVIFAYYSSEIGIRTELGYRGNAVLAKFPGCTHEPGTHGRS